MSHFLKRCICPLRVEDLNYIGGLQIDVMNGKKTQHSYFIVDVTLEDNGWRVLTRSFELFRNNIHEQEIPDKFRYFYELL